MSVLPFRRVSEQTYSIAQPIILLLCTVCVAVACYYNAWLSIPRLEVKMMVVEALSGELDRALAPLTEKTAALVQKEHEILQQDQQLDAHITSLMQEIHVRQEELDRRERAVAARERRLKKQ